MRSIGKVNIKKLNKMVAEEIKKRTAPYGIFEGNYADVRSAVKENIPEEWYDIWESAYSEIERLIDDAINNQ